TTGTGADRDTGAASAGAAPASQAPPAPPAAGAAAFRLAEAKTAMRRQAAHGPATDASFALPRPLPAPWSAAPANTERYAAREDNPVRRTSEHPLSTFSIDVDTGSYANVRRMLDQGMRPPADAVRTEE